MLKYIVLDLFTRPFFKLSQKHVCENDDEIYNWYLLFSKLSNQFRKVLLYLHSSILYNAESRVSLLEIYFAINFILSSFFHNQSKSGNHETVFMSNAYNLQLLEGFNALRSQVLLCDVTLISGSSRFPVHRALLAACSPYFKEMFTKDNHTGKKWVLIHWCRAHNV